MAFHSINTTAAIGFQNSSQAYQKGRPDYPRQGVDFFIQEFGIGAATKVLDLAAGTGKFTQALVASGASLCAVEPVKGMRDQFQAFLPQITVVDGTAEKIPFVDESFDCVFVAQSFHWFQAHVAAKEIHRVLRPKGKIGLLWNVRDESQSWVQEMSKLLDEYEGSTPRYMTMQWKAPFDELVLFAPLQRKVFAHYQEGNEEELIQRVTSISFIAALPSEKQQKVIQDFKNILQAPLRNQSEGKIRLPYICNIYWSEKRELV